MAARPLLFHHQAREKLEMRVVDPAKVTRLALQNAGSMAGLVLTVDCMTADAPVPGEAARGPDARAEGV